MQANNLLNLNNGEERLTQIRQPFLYEFASKTRGHNVSQRGASTFVNPGVLASCGKMYKTKFKRMLARVVAFQQKLILPTFCVALAIGIAGYFMVWSTPLVQGTGFGYILAGPLTHYFIYELRNENEYYFYFNMGFNKIMLYSSTVILNLIVGALILFYA